MTLLSSASRLAGFADRTGDWLLPTLARLVFAAVLLSYFLTSAGTKLDGLFSPSIGAYAQIYPRLFETVGYDPSGLAIWQKLVVLFGAWAEVVLPVLIVLGLATRLAALGMMGFVLIQSLTDVYGHGSAWGAWFDPASDALILDQRALWMLLLVALLLKGAGPLSADRLLRAAFPRLAT
ncbi:MAG: DoxX family protein [Tabrizicola sp.]|jgi:putative oxidoreductase|nr:DoxX family protein [Tabrizicola sp.]